MSVPNQNLGAKVRAFSARIGNDPLLVQGAGGNVSWKDGDTLWVKASGTWLEDAAGQNIFVPVDLQHLRKAIGSGDFDVAPKTVGESTLKPSIETLLHALMPQKVVVHVHAVEALAYLVRNDCELILPKLLKSSPAWMLVDYYKPGKALAQAVATATARNPHTKIVFLQNHGAVIGGDDVEEVEDILATCLRNFTNTSSAEVRIEDSQTPHEIEQYFRIPDAGIQQLALDPQLYSRLESSWALYPDHVVFLGPQPFVFGSLQEFVSKTVNTDNSPALAFVYGTGVYAKPGFNRAKHAQLRCYFEVLKRQVAEAPLRTLSATEVADLLNWDAERYRMELIK